MRQILAKKEKYMMRKRVERLQRQVQPGRFTKRRLPENFRSIFLAIHSYKLTCKHQIEGWTKGFREPSAKRREGRLEKKTKQNGERRGGKIR